MRVQTRPISAHTCSHPFCCCHGTANDRCVYMKHIQRAGGVQEAHAGAFLLRYLLGGMIAITGMYRTLPDGRPARRCLVRAQLLDLLHMGGRCSLSGLVRVQGQQVARAESEVCKFSSSLPVLQHIDSGTGGMLACSPPLIPQGLCRVASRGWNTMSSMW